MLNKKFKFLVIYIFIQIFNAHLFILAYFANYDIRYVYEVDDYPWWFFIIVYELTSVFMAGIIYPLLVSPFRFRENVGMKIKNKYFVLRSLFPRRSLQIQNLSDPDKAGYIGVYEFTEGTYAVNFFNKKNESKQFFEYNIDKNELKLIKLIFTEHVEKSKYIINQELQPYKKGTLFYDVDISYITSTIDKYK